MKLQIRLRLAVPLLILLSGCEDKPPPDFRMDIVDFLVSQAQIAAAAPGRKVPVALAGITALATHADVSEVTVDLVYDGPDRVNGCRYVLTGRWNASERALREAAYREVCRGRSRVLPGAFVVWRGRQTPSAECLAAQQRGDDNAANLCKADDCRRKNELTLLIPGAG